MGRGRIRFWVKVWVRVRVKVRGQGLRLKVGVMPAYLQQA